MTKDKKNRKRTQQKKRYFQKTNIKLELVMQHNTSLQSVNDSNPQCVASQYIRAGC